MVHIVCMMVVQKRVTFYSINSSDVLERHYVSVCTFIRDDASRLLISIFPLDLFGCLEYFIGIPWKWTRIIYFLYMGRISLLTLHLPLYLSLSEIEVDNIFFQHKGRNPQEQYFLSMKFCMDWTFFCKSKYPNISYSWFIRILSFLSLIYLSFFSLIGSELETDFQNLCSMDRLLRFHIFIFLLFTLIVFTSVQASNGTINCTTIDCGKDLELTRTPNGVCETCESTHGTRSTNSHGDFVCLCNGAKHRYNCNGPT